MSNPLDSLFVELIFIRVKSQILRESSLEWLILAKNIGFELRTKFLRLFQGLFTQSDVAVLDVLQNLLNRVFLYYFLSNRSATREGLGSYIDISIKATP